MDQDKNTQAKDEQQASDVELENNETKETSENLEATSDESIEKENVVTEPQVIVKKSSNKLALLLSLLALIASAYLLYVTFLGKPNKQDSQNLANQILDLENANQQLKQQLRQQDQNSSTAIQQLQQQIDALANQPKPQADGLTFDNSGNEAALSQLEAQMKQQFSDQSDELNQLKQQLKTTQPIQSVAKEVLPDPVDLYDSKRAIDALYAADLLIRTQRLPQAISTLEQLLDTANLRTSTQHNIQQLLNSWQRIEQPDTHNLMQQLQQIKSDIKHLKLNTESTTTSKDNEPWYSRFVSVKKINSDAGLADSHQLHLLQAELTQQLLQAEWALTLHQSKAWQTHLTMAAQTLEQTMPGQKTMVQSLNSLASKPVVALLPTPSGIHDLINELKGQR